jgi:hypothetical protein
MAITGNSRVPSPKPENRVNPEVRKAVAQIMKYFSTISN